MSVNRDKGRVQHSALSFLEKIAVIADIHFGATTDDEYLFKKELLPHFIAPLKVYDPTVIVIAGDLLDKKLAMNTTAAIFCNLLISTLVKEFPDTYILVIHGTITHDYNQLDSFNHYVSEKFRIYKGATVDYINGMKFLILPEEYHTSKDAYGELLEDSYDFVFGHGMFDHVAHYTSTESFKKNKCVFSYKDFKNVYGYVFFGHIHKSTIYKNIIYTGSFPRFSHGEEEPKGFYTVDYDKEKKKATNLLFRENRAAKTYKTILFSTLPESRNEFLKALKNSVSTYDYVRISIDTPLKIDSERERVQDIMGLVKTSKNVVLHKMKQTVEKQTVNPEKDAAREERLKKYATTNDWIDVSIMFAKNELKETLTKDEILDAIKEG